MPQHITTTQGTKRRYSGFSSSPQTLHSEDTEIRRLPYPPMGGPLQAPQVGVAVVTVDMFREHQNQVMANFERQGNLIALLQERTEALEGRIKSLEEAEDMAIDAVRQIRDDVLPRVERYQESIDSLSATASRHTALLENQDHEHRARDASRPNQYAWRPGPLGNANSEQTKSTMEDLKAQVVKSIAKQERRVEDTDSCLRVHIRRLTDQERRLEGFDARLASLERYRDDHTTHLLAQDRRFGEHNSRLEAQAGHIRNHDICVAGHNERLGLLEKTGEKLSGRVGALEQRTDHGLSPAQISAIMQNHQQRLESFEQNLQRHVEALEAALAARPGSPLINRPPLATPAHQARSESHDQPSEIDEPTSAQQYATELRRFGRDILAITDHLYPLEERMAEIARDCERSPRATWQDDGKEMLRKTNFQRPDELAKLRRNESAMRLMPLFPEIGKGDEASFYTVRSGCVLWMHFKTRDRDRDGDPARERGYETPAWTLAWKRPEWENYPRIIELERNASMSTDRYFPRYLYEVGDIFNVMSKGKIVQMPTGYHLVVDVTKPEKSLWMVYNLGNGRTPYKPDLSWHPFTDVDEFDIAMVFERFEDWEGQEGGFERASEVVRRTAALIRPSFVEPVFEEMVEAIRKGWEV